MSSYTSVDHLVGELHGRTSAVSIAESANHNRHAVPANLYFPQSIDRVCDTEFREPNVPLMLEICDLVVKKGKSTPREAAFAITRNINSRSTTGAMHALLLLDYCVKNCGYPFHLIISTKEFLNELVRRFPERATNVTMVHQRILELVQQWNSTLCVTSRYKDDFRHINDMFRLLSYKGYRVPPLSKEEAAVLNATQSFQTEDELEEEDKIAQGAKLQELLRVGTPAALERANDLMKIMSGYDTDRIPNYKKQVEQEINRIEQRAILLNDILIQKQPDERYRPDSTMEELLGSTKSAQARIQKLISENDEDDRMGRLLELNDLINTVLSKYTDFKAGRAVQGAVARAPPVLPAKDAPTPQKPVISLIDLDDWGAPGPGVSSGPSTTSPAIVAPTPVKPQNGGLGSLMDDLGDLNFSTPPQQQPNPSFGGSGFAGLSFAPPQASTPPFGFQQQRPPAQQQQQQQSAFNAGQQGTPQGNFSQAFGSSLPGTPPIQQQSQAFGVQQNQQQLRQQPAASTPPIQQQQQQQQRPDPFGGGDLFGKLAGLNQGFSSSSAPATPPPMSVPGTPPPGASLSSQKEVMLHDKNGLQIKYRLLWKGNAWSAQAVFINVTPVPFTNLAFQVATPKSMTLHMETASGNVIPPLNQSQVIQGMHIVNPAKEPLRIRYKVQYAVNGAMVNEQGDFNES